MANCSGVCISESDFNGFLEHPMWGCDGNPNVHPGGGNWLGGGAPVAATAETAAIAAGATEQ